MYIKKKFTQRRSVYKILFSPISWILDQDPYRIIIATVDPDPRPNTFGGGAFLKKISVHDGQFFSSRSLFEFKNR
jgi:hypothetical protein